MTVDSLASIAGIIVSLALSYIPGLTLWYDRQDGQTKRIIILAVGVMTVGALLGLSCAGVQADWLPHLPCTQVGVLDAVWLLIQYAIASQAAYLLTPRRATRT